MYSVIKARELKHSHDSAGYEATVGYQGVPVVHVFDDGWGGCLQLTWADETSPKVVVGDRRFTPYEAGMMLHVLSLPPSTYEDDEGKTQQLPYDLELYLNELIAEYLNMKDFSKILNKAVVVFNGEKFLEFKHSSPEEALAAVRKKWPDSNPLCLNIMTLEEAYQLYKKHMPA